MSALVLVMALGACSKTASDTTSRQVEPISTRSKSTTTASTTATLPSIERPSQSVEDAQRDGVLPELAELPLGIRSEPKVTIGVEEGNWVASQPTEDAAPLTLGDTTGEYGTDFISVVEYGELLLVTDHEIERAYPMTGFPPSWLLSTDEGIYVGHIGDGGLPWSVIGRVDRTTLEPRFIMFPAPGVEYDYWPDQWRLIPEGYDVQLVGMDAPPSDSFVSAKSWIGTVYVNLEEVEKLFSDG